MRLAVILSIIVACMALPTNAHASASCNSGNNEAGKFVYRSGTGLTSYGVMGTMYAYNRQTASDNCPNANTIFIRLNSIDYIDFVETGFYFSTRGYPNRFLEYRIAPSNDAVLLVDTDSGMNFLQWDSFALTPITGTTKWKSEWVSGTTQSGFAHEVDSVNLLSDHGISEAEMSRRTVNGDDYHEALKYRPSTGGWVAWGSLACDTGIAPDNSFDVIKVSNTEWYTTAGAPVGGC